MANLLNIDLKKNTALVTLELTEEEYHNIKSQRNLLVVPINALSDFLTTGRLGNSNRVMLPNKILKKGGIETLRKKVPSNIFKTKNGKFLVIQLEGYALEIPEFK